MTKSELIDKIHLETENLTKKQTKQIMDVFVGFIKDTLSKGDKLEIRGFGNFTLHQKNARRARNPRTGEMVNVPSKKSIHFKMGKELKEMVEQVDR